MFCFKCGKELIESASFCHYCGTNVSKLNKTAPVIPEELIIEPPIMAVIAGDMNETPQEVYESPTVDTEVCRQPSKLEIYFKRLFSQPIFLVTTILFSVMITNSLIISLINGSLTTPVEATLVAISLWLLFAAAKRSAHQNEYIKPLKILRVTALISYIANWIIVGLIALLGIIMTIASLVSSDLVPYGEFNVYDMSLQIGTDTKAIFVVFGVIILVVAVGLIFANIFGLGRMQKFAKEFVEHAKEGEIYTKGLKQVKIWLLILAAAEAVVTLLFFVLNHCVASYEYLLGEYTVPVTDVIFTFSSLLLSVGCMVCLALCVKSPEAINENIVDNSEKDDIIEVYS